MSSGGGYSGTGDRADLNNHSNQCNPNSTSYQGYTSGYSGSGTRSDLNNHANQMNPNNSRYQGGSGKRWRSSSSLLRNWKSVIHTWLACTYTLCSIHYVVKSSSYLHQVYIWANSLFCNYVWSRIASYYVELFPKRVSKNNIHHY